MVAYLRRRIEDFGIKLEYVALAIKSEQTAQTEARYRNATGDSWGGRGEMPQRLKQAISAGQSIQHFELRPNVSRAPLGKERVDWRNDPFAGSSLARTQRQ